MARQTHSALWPRAGRQALICSDGGHRLVAVVTSATSLSLRLEVAEAPRGGHAMLEYVAGDRAFRLAGELDGRDPDGHWRFVPGSRPVLLDRREHIRTAVGVTIVLTSSDGALRRVGRTLDLSAGGAFAELDGDLSVGQRLRFALVPRVGSGILKGHCHVVRTPSQTRAGVAFDDLTAEQAELLAAFILRHRP